MTEQKKTWVNLVPNWAPTVVLVIFIVLLSISFFTGKALRFSPFGWVCQLPLK